MKKVCAVLLCIGAVALCAAGCSAETATFEEKSYLVPEGVTALQIAVRDRRIAIEPSPDAQIHILYYENAKEFYAFASPDAATLHMSSQSQKEWSDYIGQNSPPENRTIRLQLPERALTSLELTTTNEDLVLPPLAVAENIALKTTGGDIQFDALEVGTALELEVKNGDITGTIEGSYDEFAIACNTKKGENNLPQNKPEGEKELLVTANNGDVEITFTGRQA